MQQQVIKSSPVDMRERVSRLELIREQAPQDIVVRSNQLEVNGSPVALMDAASGEFVLPSNDPVEVRRYLVNLTRHLLATPGEGKELEVKHTFLDGMYIRELLIPKGSLIVGKIHKQACVNIVSKGDISVLTESGSARVRAGFSVVSPTGIQKLGYAHEDTVFVNVFRTDETDVTKIDNEIAWDSYEAAGVLTFEGDAL